MRVLVTRPLDDVGPLVAALRARGHEAMVEPMLQIERRADAPRPLPLDGVQALVFTSANGVRAFADLSAARDLPVFAVGDASAEAARAAGFATVHSAGGDVADLARLVRARLDPAKGAVFHPAASQLAGDLQGALEDAGFTLRRVALYEAQPAVDLSPSLRQALSKGDLDAAVFFSPRTARTFIGLVEQANLAGACARLQAICLSDAVAARLAPIAWARTWVAARPDQAALLAQLDQAAAAAASPPAARKTATDADGAPAHEIIAAFGGIRPMAGKLGVAVSTVQGWRERGSIPAARHGQIQAAADTHHIRLDANTLTSSDQGGDTTAPADGKAPEMKTPDTKAPDTRSPTAKESDTAAQASRAQPSSAKPSPPPGAEAPPGQAGAGRVWVGFALGMVAVAVGAGLAIAGRDLWLPTPPPAAPAGDVAGLEARLATVERDVRAAGATDSQAANAAATQAAKDAMAEVDGKLAALQKRLDGVSEEVAVVAAGGGSGTGEEQAAALKALEARLGGEIDALGGRVDAIDGRLTGLQDKLQTLTAAASGTQAASAGETALTLAVLQLRDAIRGAAPFTTELQAVLDVAKSPAVANGAELAAAVAPLAPYAAAGVPNLATLKAEFPGLAREIAAQGQGAGDESWLAGIKRRVSGLVSVRPIGPVEGDSPAAIAARAEAALGKDDLAGAAGELAALQGPAAEAAGPWLTGAKGRLVAHAALNDLSRGLIARLGAGAQ